MPENIKRIMPIKNDKYLYSKDFLKTFKKVLAVNYVNVLKSLELLKVNNSRIE